MTGKHDARDLTRPLKHIAITVACLVAGTGLIGTFTTITGAVTARGVIVMAQSARSITHRTGGIVAGVYVKEGTTVAAGDRLFSLDASRLSTALGDLERQQANLMLSEARLKSESAGLDEMAIPEHLPKSIDGLDALIAAERALFAANRSAILAERSRLRAEHRRSRILADALDEQIRAKEQEIDLITRQIESLRKHDDKSEDDKLKIHDLHPHGKVAEQRNFALERDRARLVSELQRLKAARAEAVTDAGGLDPRLARLEADTRHRALIELGETTAKLEAIERERAALERDIAASDVRAEIAGLVRDLAIGASGTRLEAGAVALTIASPQDQPMIEAEIAPSDVSAIAVGHRARVRMPSGPPDVNASVASITAETPREARAASRFIARLTPEPGMETAHLVPGLAVEVAIETAPRSTLSYILRPLTEALTHPVPR